MKKFIEEVLNNQTFLDVLYNFGSFYKGSNYEQNMSDFYNSPDKTIQFISKNTVWLFIADDGDCYGILNEFVMKVDNEGIFSYVCNGFENLAEYLLQDKLNLSSAKYYCKQKNITLDKVLKDYNQILNKHSLVSSLIINEQEFKNYLNEQLK